MRDQSEASALAAGLLFLLHPTHAEPVSWISALPDVLQTTFALGTWLAWIRYRRTGNMGSLLGAACAFGLALLTKESALAVPLVVAALDLGFPARASARFERLRPLTLFAGIAVLYLVLRRAALGAWIGGYGATVHLQMDPIGMLKNLPVFIARSILPPIPLSRRELLTALLVGAVVVDHVGGALGHAATGATRARSPCLARKPDQMLCATGVALAPQAVSSRAGDRDRTGDVQLGKLAFYH